MGYTHYWHQKRAFTDAEWQRLCAEATRIFAATTVPLAAHSGESGTQPEVDMTEAGPGLHLTQVIAFNGEHPYEHEPLVLSQVPAPPRRPSPDGIFHFCKTGHAPYDTVVVEVLKAAKTIAPDALDLSSDGENVFA